MLGKTVQILGIKINSTSTGSVLEKIIDFVANSRGKLVIFTPNPEFLVEAQKDKSFKEVLNKADINVPDGIGLVWASKLLGDPINERVSGADLVEKLLKVGNEQKWRVGIVGARSGGLSHLEIKDHPANGGTNIKYSNQKSNIFLDERQILLERLKEKYPDVDFVDLDDTSKSLNPYHLILACHGMVRQEKWIIENKNKFDVKVFMGIGGSLDFLVGFTKRAPLWMRKIGLEWLWRGLQRPGHWKRILTAVIIFPLIVIKEKFNS